MDDLLVTEFAGLFGLILVSGFFAGAEAAIFSLSRLKLRRMKEQGIRTADVIMRLLEDPRKLLITILFCNLLVNTLLSALSTVVALDLARRLGFDAAAVTFAMTVLVTYLLVVFGEVTPINLGLNYASFFSRLAAYPVWAVSLLLTRVIPIQPLLTLLTNRLIPLFGGEVNASVAFITKAELHSTIALGTTEGLLAPAEKEIIRSIFTFSDTTVKEIMTPRIDMITVRTGDTLFEALQIFRAEGFNRVPVIDGSVDNVVGIVHIKDILPYLSDLERQRTTRIKALLRDPYFIPSTKKIDDLLKDFQNKNLQMAIVIDEYGGTEGLVTMEDVLEEIVGDIQDEYDEEASLVTKVNDLTYLLDARVPVSDLNDLFGGAIDEEGIDSVGGLVLHLLGRLPTAGEKVAFENLQFEIKAVQGFRILKVVVRKLKDAPPPPPDPEAGAE